MLVVIWIAVLGIAFYLYTKQAYSRFKKYGVKHLPPVPLFGNMAGSILRTEHFAYGLGRAYKAFPGERFIGNYEFVNSQVIIRDLELLKRVTVKDFDHFVDHRVMIDDKVDPFFGRNLFSLKGQEWKDMRSTLSPAFTSSKIRLMVPFMVDVGNQMIESLSIKLKESGKNYIDIDVKDLATRYANDVIASCAFGLKVDSHLDRENQFYVMGKDASTFGFFAFLKFFGYNAFPKFMKILKVNLFSESVRNYFKSLVLSTMRNREVAHIIRPDMIHLLMEAKRGKLTHDEKSEKDDNAGFATVEETDVGKKQINREWSDLDLIAQAILFFIAGFETVSTAMTFLLYELAINPDVQDRLAQEIKENHELKNGVFDYNSIQNLTYLDMVVSESLRLWPPAIATDRQCFKNYNLGKPNDKATEDFIIRKGEAIAIPIWGIHRDPEYFPDPDRFDPERFSEENKDKINPFTYMPFGLGPRNCIGSRFALCEVKVMVYQLLLQMKISPSPRTPSKPKLSTESFNLRLQGGHELRMELRH